MEHATPDPRLDRPHPWVRVRQAVAPDPRGLPPPLRLEARLVPLRAIGALVIALALPLLGVTATVGGWAAAVPLVSLLYNGVVAWALHRRPSWLAGGRTTQAFDTVLVAAATTLLETLIGQSAHLVVLTLVVAAGLRFGVRSVLLVAALYCGFGAVLDLGRGQMALGALVVQAGFGILAGTLAALVRREALAGEARHAALFAEAADAILVADAAGRCVDANPAACTLFGRDRYELLGSDVVGLTRVDPARATGIKSLLEGTGRWQGEIEIGRTDGQSVVVETRVSTIADADGPLRVAILRDVTERKEAEQQRTSLAQAEKLRALGQMAGGVAHDLNQSLGMVAGYAELARRTLADRAPDLVRAREMLETVEQAALEGGETVRRLLVFARPALEGPTEAVALGPLLEGAVRLTAPRWRDAAQAEGRPIRVEVDANPAAVVDGQPGALRQALTNLVFNAVDALPQGGTIRLSARRLGARVEVAVADDGVGMPPAVRARLFEPFFTTKAERGTGLGLAQVHTIVQAHGGTAAVTSEEGTGTTIRLLLPAADVPTPSAAHAGDPAGPGGKLRVLVVDDEARLVRMAAAMLRGRGHAVETATSAEAALGLLGAVSFDAVVSDLSLGDGMNGWELASTVRGRWPDVRVVLATGWGAGIDPVAARARGVAAVVAKPYAVGDLQRALVAD